ncbi:MAG: lipoprotein [Candidatus Peregrinibacteria bacterium Greene1014_49]|nr:MAG: lipoprotein [Candidatus Peregrinibacteria bacterium Greene1014_49]
MPRPLLHSARKSLQWLTVSLGVLTLAVVSTAVEQGTSVEGRLLPPHMRGAIPWKTISADQMGKGTTAPADTNVIIQIPDDAKQMTLDVLTGYRGKDIRFWGYCFPENYDRDSALTKKRFPGTVFLSKRERELRLEQQMNLRQQHFTVENNLTEEDLNQERVYRGSIRHQQEVFRGGTSCFLMTERPLPIGTDNDKDRANTAIERDVGSDPQNADTDADGVQDGAETFFLATNPVLRDSDGDGLIDGIEDKNFNGRRDLDETDATKWDTDADGLCDGLCKVEKGQKLRGEDKNINGVLDEGEFNPLLIDSDGDDILDLQEVFVCELGGGTDC